MTLEKRKNNWWEPIFNKDVAPFKQHDWDFSHSNSAKNSSFKFDEERTPRVIKDKEFDCCDFEGDFTKSNIKFIGCTFLKCDFGNSRWLSASFRKCDFKETSFTLSTFEECEFRECTYENISYSGNRTLIPGTLITNPLAFLCAAGLFVENLPDHVSVPYQKLRLVETMSTMSRVVLANLRREGSEVSYYEAVKATTLLAAKARHVPVVQKMYGTTQKLKWKNRVCANLFGAAKASLFFSSGYIEVYLLQILGFMNAWGGSIIRTLIFGVGLVAVFWMVHVFAFKKDYLEAFVQAFETFFLFGYTNFTNDLPENTGERLIFMLNAFLGIVWYVINVPTVVNKITRLRG